MQVYKNQDNASAIDFLKRLINITDLKIQVIKTDNAFYFTNRHTGYNKPADLLNPRLHLFNLLCDKLGMPHYLIDPGKSQQNSFVERLHKTDQEKFYEQVQFISFGTS